MNNIRFCENMNYYRTKLGLTFAELSDKLKAKGLDITAATLQRYECGKIKNVPYEALVLLAEVFNTTPTQLLGWEKPVQFHRSLDLNSRFNDIITELTVRGETFNIDGKELTKQQTEMARIILENTLELIKNIVNIDNKEE